MPKEKKSYLDLFLDNVTIPKKRGKYFGDEQEQAIVKFNSSTTSSKEKVQLFSNIIEPSFKNIVRGVLEMPMFHNLGKLNRDDLIDNTLYRLIEKMSKFTPNMIGKSGQPVKAYSYFSTIAKHHILEQKIRHEKVLRHKADVESSIDLTILSEDTLQKMSNYDKQDVHFNDYENIFNETQQTIINEITKVIIAEESKDKPDADLIKLGYYLRYLIKNWDKLEFMKKNEFMRILSLYVGLKQQQVSLLFKKFKFAVLENINPSILNKNKSFLFKLDKEEDFDEEESNENDEIDEEDKEDIVSYKVNSMEDFEIENERISNIKFKSKSSPIKTIDEDDSTDYNNPHQYL